MAANYFEKLTLLLWKNWLIQWSNKIQLSVELFVPFALSFLLVYGRTKFPIESYDINIYDDYFSLDSEELHSNLKETSVSFHLAYSPNTSPIFKNIIKQAARILDLEYSGHANSRVLEDVALKNNYLCAIEFDEELAHTTKLPTHLNYRIRFPHELRTMPSSSWLTNNLFIPGTVSFKERNKYEPDGGAPPGYLKEGFLAVQNAIAKAYIEQANQKVARGLPEIQLRRYPYPGYTDDYLMRSIGPLLPMMIFISFMYSSSYLIQFITAEKENQLKEVMKMMGLPNCLHWTAWFIQSFCTKAISILLLVIVLSIGWGNNSPVLIYSSHAALFFFFLVYIAALVTFCLMASTFFSKANTASLVSGILTMVSMVPYIYFTTKHFDVPAVIQIISSLFCNTGMGVGLKIIIDLEAQGVGLQWSTMFTSVRPDDPVTVGYVVEAMILSCFLCMTVCLYIEQINPGEFGVPKKWYFPFTPSFWLGNSRNFENDGSQRGFLNSYPEGFEAEPTGKRVGIEVKNLSKSFGKFQAVKGVSMNMYEDQITVLLGHNGAGKTTTISMLTGMFAPTSGTAILNGYDIRTRMNDARASLGICPQHNILFDELTVKQHLIFYATLKGLKGKKLEREVKSYMKKIQIEKKANVASASLSGGMKRKLSVCAALCGGSKVVLCDEPSSGMDPAARRQLWDFLHAERTGRTILLTTHFMDEADVLGDRIAIMSAGELKCMGTPFFLKKVFGSGYFLVCVKKSKCISAQVTQLLRRYIPDIEPASDLGAELSYQLPERYSSSFEGMFADLEQKSDELNIDGYGISITSLEEVFIKVGAEKATETEDNGHQDLNEMNEFLSNKHNLKGLRLCFNQWRAMIIKKIFFTLRNKLILFFQNITPVFFIFVMLGLQSSKSLSKLPPMTFKLDQYAETVTVLETSSDVRRNSLEWKVAQNYKDLSPGGSHVITDIGETPFVAFILSLGENTLKDINTKYLTAATIEDGQITAWLNNQPLHTAPLTLNLIHNAMARTLTPAHSISVTNAPLPLKYRPPDDKDQDKDLAAQFMLIFKPLVIGMNVGLIISFYVSFIINERETRAKLIQFISGVKVLTFWLTHFIWDFFTFIISTIIILAAVAFFEPEFPSYELLGQYFLLILLFGFSVIPLTYLVAFFFEKSSVGLSVLTSVYAIAGIAVFALNMFTHDKYEKFFLAIPFFSLTQGIYDLSNNELIRKQCYDDEDCLDDLEPFYSLEPPGILLEMLSLIVTGIIFFVILLLNDCRCFDALSLIIFKTFTNLPPLSGEDDIDKDVKEERERIRSMSPMEIQSHNLVLDRFSKFYGEFLAVKRLSVGVKKSECFGLLGVNGAGKTTTFKILTGDQRMFFGKAFVKGLSLKTKMNEVNKEIGYCPQFDAVFEELTGEENLKLFGLLLGIPSDRIDVVSMQLAKTFGFAKHYKKPVRTYSGGNKRKLSTAIAIMGGPSVLYLDEPTTGMDPASRRQLWNVLCAFRDSGKTIILTSHSMEECEALCTRLAIMVNGEFKCIGSTQHLKNRFSKGFVLRLKLKKSPGNTDEQDVQNVNDFINRAFPEAKLQERFQRILTFYIPLAGISWSRIFGIMERNKGNLNIEDYSISQTTLEAIFLQFAEAQRNDPRNHTMLSFC